MARVGLMTALYCSVVLSVVGDITLQDGKYKGVVAAVQRDTPVPASREDFTRELKAFLQSGSEALNTATHSGLSMESVTLIVPRDWDQTFSDASDATSDMSISAADILLHSAASLPDTLQVEQCGVPARQIQVPVSFLTLTKEEEKKYGTTGHILAHEWAHFRFGAQDENGYSGDPVYKPTDADRKVTSCFQGELKGQWRTECAGTVACGPSDTNVNCYYCVDSAASTPQITQASLGYMPALSMGHFCNASTHNRMTSSPQNVLCGKRSIEELIDAHPDSDSMLPHTPSPVTLTTVHEPLARVLLLLDTQDSYYQKNMDYKVLLDSLKIPLTKYSRQYLGVMTYEGVGAGKPDKVETVRDFNTIDDAGSYSDLYAMLPKPAQRVSTPSLKNVLSQVLEDTKEYQPGTLVVIPLTEPLVQAAQLDDSIAHQLHQRRMKPLLLFPEDAPALADLGPFLQWSGSRLLSNNGTGGSVDYASQMAEVEVLAFVDVPYTNDHPIVHTETRMVGAGEIFEIKLTYQSFVVGNLVAVVTSNKDATDLTLKYKKFGMYKDCKDTTNLCSYSSDDKTIFFKQTVTDFAVPGEEWYLEITNNGASADISIVMSEMNFCGVEQELDVDVWLSDGRGPIADIFQNRDLILYASVHNDKMQVLSSRITVTVDIEVTTPVGTKTPYTGIQLLDNGNGGDIRRDDSVFSITLLDGEVVDIGTVITVKSLTIGSHSGINKKDASPPHQDRLYSPDTSETECCGSYVDDPDTDLNHRINGFNLFLWDTFPPMMVNRKIDPTLTTTSTTTTTTTTTTTPKTTTIPDTTTSNEDVSTSDATPPPKTTTEIPPDITTTPPPNTTTEIPPDITTTPPPKTTTEIPPDITTTPAPQTTDGASTMVGSAMLVVLLALFAAIKE